MFTTKHYAAGHYEWQAETEDTQFEAVAEVLSLFG